jgi:hypothetical protein
LLCTQAGLQPVRGFQVVSQREGFSAHGPSAKR